MQTNDQINSINIPAPLLFSASKTFSLTFFSSFRSSVAPRAEPKDRNLINYHLHCNRQCPQPPIKQRPLISCRGSTSLSLSLTSSWVLLVFWAWSKFCPDRVRVTDVYLVVIILVVLMFYCISLATWVSFDSAFFFFSSESTFIFFRTFLPPSGTVGNTQYVIAKFDDPLMDLCAAFQSAVSRGKTCANLKQNISNICAAKQRKKKKQTK